MKNTNNGAPVLQKSAYQKVKDLLFAPMRMALLPDRVSERLGLTSLEQERMRHCLGHIKGRLLDVGAGRNTLVRQYGQGVGVEVYDWGGGTLPIQDAAQLPFKSETFDTVSFVASLNHIPSRRRALQEAARVLRPHGKLVITMISPLVGLVGHKLWWYSEDKKRKMAPGEVWGLSTFQILELASAAGFTLLQRDTFLYGLNNIYVFRKNR